jgi:hypothetical protein
MSDPLELMRLHDDGNPHHYDDHHEPSLDLMADEVQHNGRGSGRVKSEMPPALLKMTAIMAAGCKCHVMYLPAEGADPEDADRIAEFHEHCRPRFIVGLFDEVARLRARLVEPTNDGPREFDALRRRLEHGAKVSRDELLAVFERLDDLAALTRERQAA